MTGELFSVRNIMIEKSVNDQGKIKSALKYQIIQVSLAKNNCPFSIRYLCMPDRRLSIGILCIDKEYKKKFVIKEDFYLIL